MFRSPIFCILLLSACASAPKLTNNSNFLPTRLGSSDYMIDLPLSYKMTEARGKEGQLGYHFAPNDEGLQNSFFVELKQGKGIVAEDDEPVESTIQALVLGEKVTFKINRNINQYYSGITREHSVFPKLTAGAYQKAHLEEMIQIMATLRKEPMK